MLCSTSQMPLISLSLSLGSPHLQPLPFMACQWHQPMHHMKQSSFSDSPSFTMIPYDVQHLESFNMHLPAYDTLPPCCQSVHQAFKNLCVSSTLQHCHALLTQVHPYSHSEWPHGPRIYGGMPNHQQWWEGPGSTKGEIRQSRKPMF